MGAFKFGLRMLKLEYKKTFFYAFTLLVTVAVVFVFFNYANNEYLGNGINATQNIVAGQNSINFSTLLSMVMVTLSILAACYSNSVYLSKKTNEIAIEEISGGCITEITSYLIAQNFTIGLITIPLGIILGYFINPILNIYLYNSLNVHHANIWYISGEAAGLTFFYIFTEILAITMVNAGFAYRNDILELLGMNHSIKAAKPTSGIRMPIIVYYILYFIPFILFIRGLTDAKSYVMVSLIGIYGIYGLYSRGLASLIEKIQTKFNLKNPIKLISVGNLKYSIAKTKTLVLLIIFSIIALMGYSILYIGDVKSFSIIYISYITCILLVTLMILYKIMLENDSHAHIFKSLMKLGYNSKQIRRIIKEEVTYYYALILFFIAGYAIPILVHFVRLGTIKLLFAIQLFALFFVPIALSGIIAYYNYKLTVFKKED